MRQRNRTVWPHPNKTFKGMQNINCKIAHQLVAKDEVYALNLQHFSTYRMIISKTVEAVTTHSQNIRYTYLYTQTWSPAQGHRQQSCLEAQV